jgi:hypothetical protein
VCGRWWHGVGGQWRWWCEAGWRRWLARPDQRKEKGSGWALVGCEGQMALGPAEATGPAFGRRLLGQKNGKKARLQRVFDLENLAADLDLFQGF